MAKHIGGVPAPKPAQPRSRTRAMALPDGHGVAELHCRIPVQRPSFVKGKGFRLRKCLAAAAGSRLIQIWVGRLCLSHDRRCCLPKQLPP